MLGNTTLFLATDLKDQLRHINDPDNSETELPLTIALEYIKNSINKFNPKMSISHVCFVNKNSSFPVMKQCKSKYFGLIAEPVKPTKKPINSDDKDDYWVDAQGNIYSTCVYVCLTVPKISSRDVFVAQQLLPALCFLMDRTITSPTHTLTDHPIYLVDLVVQEKKIPESSLRYLRAAALANIGIISIANSPMPLSTDITVQQYITEWGHYNNFECETESQSVAIKKDHFENIKGSEEKFNILNMLGGFFLARRLGYHVNYSELEQYLLATQLGGKLDRVRTIIQYFDKL
ncbi:hypothetical protein [Bifidobacterium kimbladii]|uniref:Uncharacterized protein n=1 Tax=Bifidobacterium asteroides TaxID=1684 RepID=A0A0F4L2S9_9BIFI|nr:hypothetical protein [Bifidobacterium asteroides]KJY52960.1 hypothetical protein JF69_00240 [Bifidobacterium asteroides]